MKAVVTLILYTLAGAALLAGLPYLLPLAGPFLIAFTAAAVMEPVVCALHRRGVPRSLAAGIVTILVLLVLGILLTLTVTNSVNALMTFAKRTPDLLETLSAALTDLQQRVLGLIRKAPEGVVEQLTIALEAVAGELYAVPAWLSEKLLGLVAGIAKRSPDLLLFTATTAIGVYFFSASYRDIMDFLQRQLPPKTRKKARHTDEGRDEVADIWDQPLQGAVQSLVNAGIQFHNLPAFGALIGDGLHFIHQPLAEREVRGHPYFLI